jgi:hypothetical protein
MSSRVDYHSCMMCVILGCALLNLKSRLALIRVKDRAAFQEVSYAARSSLTLTWPRPRPTALEDFVYNDSDP